MFKGYQDTSNQSQFKGFPNLNMQGAVSAYGFSGVSFWLDAAYGLNTQTNLGAVSSWQQRVGGGTFVQATAGSQPRLVLNDVNFNNYPSVESVANARFMQAQTGTGLKYSRSNTIVVVSKVNTINTANGIIGLADTLGNAFGVHDGGSGAAYTGFGIVVNNTSSLQGTTESTNARIKIITNTNIIINGVDEVTGINSFSTYDFFNLFRLSNAISSNMIGNIAEIICYNYSMTSTDAIALSDRINQKYALY